MGGEGLSGGPASRSLGVKVWLWACTWRIVLKPNPEHPPISSLHLPLSCPVYSSIYSTSQRTWAAMYSSRLPGAVLGPSYAWPPQCAHGLLETEIRVLLFPCLLCCHTWHTECHVCLKEGSSTSFPSKGSYFPCGFEQSAGVSWITESFAFLISLFLPFSLASFSLTPPFWFLSLSSSFHLSVPVHPTCLASFLPCFSLSPWVGLTMDGFQRKKYISRK